MTLPKHETLKEAMPREFSEGSYGDTRAWKMRDVLVVSEHDGTVEGWPGRHRHVFKWVKLANGYAVGWNENPSIGWSFPVIKLKN